MSRCGRSTQSPKPLRGATYDRIAVATGCLASSESISGPGRLKDFFNRTLVLVSGGARLGDEAMFEKARESMDAGATGLIFGRNVWQREYDQVPRRE
ncbi:hypothetical protein [Amycolatopsis keratiniphila]|uniref:hypothetical protein n=1 Tax=Amycolatopsis keratiniphila TaxID=129921 RepID=UPI0009DCFD5A